MSNNRNPHKRLTTHAEAALIRSVIEQFPGSTDISYFFETNGGIPDYHTLSWVYNTHRVLHVRMSWRTGNLHMKQELIADTETKSISYPVMWGGLGITFDENGRAMLEGTAARDFWAMLIGHSGEGVPKPHS